MRQHIKWWRAIGFVLLAYLFFQINYYEFYRQIMKVELWFFLMGMALNIPLLFMKSIRWRVILKDQGIEYGMFTAFLAYCESVMWGCLTPGRLGEFSRAFQVSGALGIPRKKIFPSILLDRLIDLFFLVAVVIGFLFKYDLGSSIYYILAFISLFFVFGLVILMRVGAAEIFLKPLKNVSLSWLREIIESVEETFYIFQRIRKSSLMVASLFTLSSHLIIFFQCFVLILSLDSSISPWDGYLVVLLGSLVALIPISISGLGTREAVFILYLATKNITSEEALSYSLMIFVLFYVGGTLIGSIAYFLRIGFLTSIVKVE